MSIIEKALSKAKAKENKHQISAAAQPSDKINPLTSKQMPITSVFVEQDDKSIWNSGRQNTQPTDIFTESVNVIADELGSKNEITLDWDRLAQLGFLIPTEGNTRTVEEYRNLKRPILNNAFGVRGVANGRSNLALITSSIPGEGKSFTAINLALSIANERDKQVLLIDADVALPSIARTLGVRAAPGLIEYLEHDDVEFSDIVLKTNMPGLSLVTAGRQHKYSTELLSSNKMANLARNLTEKFPNTMVIFDSPPLLAATQGEVLARLVGQVILVVEAEKTLQYMIKESVNKLSECEIVLTVLNKSKKHLEAGYYEYGRYAYSKDQ
jgi:exopolysaccharide/PEP-CTERM locus tyrosine autokinase